MDLLRNTNITFNKGRVQYLDSNNSNQGDINFQDYPGNSSNVHHGNIIGYHGDVNTPDEYQGDFVNSNFIFQGGDNISNTSFDDHGSSNSADNITGYNHSNMSSSSSLSSSLNMNRNYHHYQPGSSYLHHYHHRDNKYSNNNNKSSGNYGQLQQPKSHSPHHQQHHPPKGLDIKTSSGSSNGVPAYNAYRDRSESLTFVNPLVQDGNGLYSKSVPNFAYHRSVSVSTGMLTGML